MKLITGWVQQAVGARRIVQGSATYEAEDAKEQTSGARKIIQVPMGACSAVGYAMDDELWL